MTGPPCSAADVGRPAPSDLAEALDVFADVVGEWGTTPTSSAVLKAGKLCEEAGEAMGAVVKMLEGRATRADAADEIADVVIVAAGLASILGVDLGHAVTLRWNADVRHRTAYAVSTPPTVAEQDALDRLDVVRQWAEQRHRPEGLPPAVAEALGIAEWVTS